MFSFLSSLKSKGKIFKVLTELILIFDGNKGNARQIYFLSLEEKHIFKLFPSDVGFYLNVLFCFYMV